MKANIECPRDGGRSSILVEPPSSKRRVEGPTPSAHPHFGIGSRNCQERSSGCEIVANMLNVWYVCAGVTFLRGTGVGSKNEYLTIRVDAELKAEISKAAQVEHRSLSNISKLLLEYAWSRYLAAGSMHHLLNRNEKEAHRTLR